ncbi:hypothetical protein C367_03514 [Cryptococcus neoformans Ze90-1]|nr:hypothetical protein C367_03514 [Cryptococcus neoformans var. grubii Ze90-1]
MPRKTSATTTSKPVKPAQATSTDIDDIFAKPKISKSKPESVVEPEKKKSKGKSKAISTEEPAAPHASTGNEEKKKKKKVKTVAAFIPDEDEEGDEEEPSSKVETVVDPSTIPVVIPEPPVITRTKKDKGTKRDRKEDEDDEIFRDSRGTGPRRKTEEGFLIYKEAELKIDPEAGGHINSKVTCLYIIPHNRIVSSNNQHAKVLSLYLAKTTLLELFKKDWIIACQQHSEQQGQNHVCKMNQRAIASNPPKL